LEQVAPPPVLVITGPTASGKTSVGLAVASQLQGEIISADSRQLFRYLDIGTAKPTEEEISAVRHHFIDHIEPTEGYTAGKFAQEASEVIDGLQGRDIVPVVVGGSGLYVRALVEGIFEGPEADESLRADLEQQTQSEGVGHLYDKLLALDPECADFVPKTNIPRIIRALEVCLLTGEKFSRVRTAWMKKPAFESIVFGLRWNRDILYERINSRVLEMMERGLLDEVRSLRKRGLSPKLQSLNTVGYKECFDFLAGEGTQKEMILLIQQHTRNFAKRQMTWFRKEDRINWIDVTEPMDTREIADQIVSSYLAAGRDRARH